MSSDENDLNDNDLLPPEEPERQGIPGVDYPIPVNVPEEYKKVKKVKLFKISTKQQ